MELVPYCDTAADHALTRELESDPAVMRELGGPHSLEAIAETHKRRATQLGDDDWWLKIVPERSGEAAGTIGVWKTVHDDEQIHEVGWLVLPRYAPSNALCRKFGFVNRGEVDVVYAGRPVHSNHWVLDLDRDGG